MFNKLRKSIRRAVKQEVQISPPLNVPAMQEGELEMIVRKSSAASSANSLPTAAVAQQTKQEYDPLQQLSALNDELYTLDIASYLSLRLLLETKLGRGAHVTGSEMSRFKVNTDAICKAYGRFNFIITECLRYKQQQLDSSVRVPQPVAQVEQPTSSNDSVVINEVSPSQKSNDDLSRTQVFGISVQVVNSFAANVERTLPNLTAAEMEQLINEALDCHGVIMQCINQTQDIITAHRSNINPQAILNSQTEFGNLQRYFVHSRYKEMVKGCGPARVNHTGLVQWAGAKDPGDTWMNNLLMSYWRHHVPRHPHEKVRLKSRGKKEDNTMTNEDTLTEQTSILAMDMDRDEQQRKKIDLLQSKMSNAACLDVVDIQDLFRWVHLAQAVPMSIEHTKSSIEVVEIAVEKMGGWNLYEAFFVNWLRQFYLDYGKQSVAFPIQGCRPLTPEITAPLDASFADTPLSMSMDDLFAQGAKFTSSIDYTQWLISSSDQDQKYWNYTYKQTCKDLLFLHRTLVQEQLTNDSIKDWISSVEHSGLLKKGRYTEQTLLDDSLMIDDSVTQSQRVLMHPTLVRIRERAIVLNLCAKPEFIKYMERVDAAIRQSSTTTLVQDIQVTPYSNEKLNVPDTFKKSHRKSASTGIFNRTGMFGRKKTSPDVQPAIDANTGKLNLLAHLGFQENSPKTPLPKDIHDPFDSAKRSISAPAQPLEREVDPEATNFAEIKMMCDEILSYQPLPDEKILRKAFKISEIVVKHYLTQEIPAKYQSVY